MQDIYIGRQPIYDRNLELFAYELLYRANNVRNAAGDIDHDQATTQVVLNAFLDFGLEKLVGEKLAFINLPRSFVVGDMPLPIPKERVVLEILEDITVDDTFLSAIRQLRAGGYEIALDDFIYHPHLRPLLESTKIVKIDFLALSRAEIQDHVTALRDYDVKLVAEKIETHGDFEFARDLGFHYFQGYFFCRPHIISGRSMSTNRLATLRLLGKLLDQNTPVGELADLVSQDVALSYKLLRSLNSPFYALSKRIESIHHAIVYLGLQQIKQWVSLIVLTNITDKPSQLMAVALTRGKMCELLGDTLSEKNKESLFTVGLFSLLDALMDTTMVNVLSNLPLADDIKAALLQFEGKMGHILRWVLAYEQGRWDEIDCPPSRSKMVTQSYLQAVSWTDQVMQTF
jgi:EAL and modified HD-GYP domain-containing signal transduction protein